MITPFRVNSVAASRKTMASQPCSYDKAALKQLVTDALAYARQRGATAADAEVSEGYGQTVTARQGEVETIEYNRDKGIGVTVYIGQQRGHASTSDFAPKALRDAVDRDGGLVEQVVVQGQRLGVLGDTATVRLVKR